MAFDNGSQLAGVGLFQTVGHSEEGNVEGAQVEGKLVSVPVAPLHFFPLLVQKEQMALAVAFRYNFLRDGIGVAGNAVTVVRRRRGIVVFQSAEQGLDVEVGVLE